MHGPLEHVFVYALEVDDGVVLVDSSWAGDTSREALDASLGVLGSGIADVRGVLVTHAHPDHSGLAGRLREETGAWVALHDASPSLIDPAGPAEDLARVDDWLLALGVPGAELKRFVGMSRRLAAIHLDVAPDRRLRSGEVLDLDGLSLEVLHTPGHSPDHTCFVARELGLVLTGDHILSETTPNVGVFPGTRGSPLGAYLASLELVRGLGPILALPGHEQRVPVGARAAALLDHHASQLAHAESLIEGGAATVYEIAAGMPWSIAWEQLGILDRYLAVCETHAHLLVLEDDGRATAEVAPTAEIRWSKGQ